MARVRYAACMTHRSEAQKVVGITERQQFGLALGRPKGTNHRTGYKHRPESKKKVQTTNRRFWQLHPEQAIARGAKTRGENHYNWKGGISRLNLSIRTMTENRRWMEAVRKRDGRCTDCGGTSDLESHHIVELAVLIDRLGIKSRDDARLHAITLFNIDNGRTLCGGCHMIEHGRHRRETA